jgi:hypothetical protein
MKLNKVKIQVFSLSIIFLLMFGSLNQCKIEKKNDNNLLFLLFLAVNQTSPNNQVKFTASFGSTSTSYFSKNLSEKNIPLGATYVVAISSNNHFHKSKIDAQGNFSLQINKNQSYIFAFIDDSNNVKGYYKIQDYSLNSIPTHYSASEMNGGTISFTAQEKTGLSANSFTPKNFDLNQFKSQSGTKDEEIGSIASSSDQSLFLLNLDTDGNGKIDLEEGVIVRPRLSQQWGSNSTNYPLASANNSFFEPNILRTDSPNYYAIFFGIEQKNTIGSYLEMEYPIPANCTDTNNGKIRKNFSENGGALPSNGLSISAKEQNFNLSFNCNGTTRIIPEKGTYKFNDSGKIYTYNNIEPYLVSNNKTIIVPSVKFTTSGGVVSKLEYQFKKVSSASVSNATDREVNLVYGNSQWQAGIICYDAANEFPFSFSCFMPYTKSSGDVTSCQSGSNVKNSTPIGTNFSRYFNCFLYTIDTNGSMLGYGLYR